MSDDKSIALTRRYDGLVGSISQILDAGRRQAARTLNSVISAVYWEVGRRIVEFEQAGRTRADYRKRVIDRLSTDLTKRYGKGFGRSNLFQIRAFYIAYRGKVQTVSGQSSDSPAQMPSGRCPLVKARRNLPVERPRRPAAAQGLSTTLPEK